MRALTDELALYVELDTCDTNPQNLTRALDICRALGVDRLRVYSSVGGDVKEELEQAVKDFRQVIPLCADYGVRIAYENHEYETSHDVLQVVREVDSEYVGTHVDTGNSMFIWVCYGYVAPFRLSEGEGHGAKLGRGSFRVQPPPHDPSVIAPYTSRSLDTDVELQSWAWQDMAKLARAEEERGELLALQAQAVIDSVAYVKGLNLRGRRPS